MSDNEKRKPQPDEPVTAGPWAKGASAPFRVRWTERLAQGATHDREKAFDTREEAEAFKGKMEATGVDVTFDG